MAIFSSTASITKDPNRPTKFAFESKAWKEGVKMTIMLQKVFRQRGDVKFIDMLNRMRLGNIDDETEREFKKLSKNHCQTMKLFPRNFIVPEWK